MKIQKRKEHDEVERRTIKQAYEDGHEIIDEHGKKLEPHPKKQEKTSNYPFAR